MGSIQKKRPTAVTVIGWIFIAGAILMIFSGRLGLRAFSFMQHWGEEAPFHVGVMEAILQHFGLIVLVQVCLAAFAFLATIEFSRLRRWACTALEVISWFGLFYFVVNGTFCVSFVIAVASSASFAKEASEFSASPMACISGAVGGFVAAIFWAVPFIIVLIFLRTKKIREVLS